jgi:lipopolysaccharide/colanic/teichoic acid biosynthesis glycosyltransferase
MKNENISTLDKIDHYLRKEDTVLAKSIHFLDPLVGATYRKSLTKRAVESAIVVPVAILSLPLLATIALFIKAEDRGPILYKQKRKLNAETDFDLCKLRSMRVNTDKEINHSTQIYSVSGKENDSRCTRIGRFIRKFDFDELPQLWQILAGTMSLIGFRAQPNYSIENIKNKCPLGFNQWLNKYYEGNPAILNLLSTASHLKSYQDSDKIHYDSLYARKASLGLDLYILWRHLNNALRNVIPISGNKK